MPIKTTLLLIYSLYIASCALAYQFALLPFPYTKAPLGLLIGTIAGSAISAATCLPFHADKKQVKIQALFSIALTLFAAFIMRYIPLNIDDFHITTNVNRISILIGMATGVLSVTMYNFARVVKNTNLSTEK